MNSNTLPSFLPAFGARPAQLVGREQAIGDLLGAFASPPASRTRNLLISGNKGMGKTALLSEMATWAQAQGYVALTASPTESVYADVLHLGSEKPVFVAVDDVAYETGALRALASACTKLRQQDKQVVCVLSGLPANIEKIGLFPHAKRMSLKELPLGKVQRAFETAAAKQGIDLKETEAAKAAKGTFGHPFLMQSIGAYLLEDPRANTAIAAAVADLPSTLFAPVLEALSAKDMEFLCAMAQEGDLCSVSALRERMGVSDNYLQPYRARLVRSGAVVSPQRGKLAFALPYLGDYLRNS